MGTTAADAAAAAAAALNNDNAGAAGAGGAGGADDAAAKAAADKAAPDKAAADKAAADNAGSGNETPEQKAAREKAEADKKAAAAGDVVPEKYDLKLPDGFEGDPAVVERTAADARELGLSNERAQKLLDRRIQEAADVEQSAIDRTLKAHAPGGAVWEKQVEDWNKAALADPLIGGNKPEQLHASVALAKQVLSETDTRGENALTDLMAGAGAGLGGL